MKILATDDEYLVALPYDQRHRAKLISGYRWDPVRKVWGFPRTLATRQALTAEFGPDEVTFLDGDGNASESMEQEILRLRTELLSTSKELLAAIKQAKEALEDQLSLFRLAIDHGFDPDGDSDQLAAFLRSALANNATATSLAAEAATLRAQVAQLRRDGESTSEEHERLRARYRELETHLAGYASKAVSDESAVVLRLAADFTGARAEFESVTSNFRLDADFPVRLQNTLSALLAPIVSVAGEPRLPFAEVLERARDARVITTDAFRYCHFIRVQRNLFAHEALGAHERRVRSALALLAFALVLRELPPRK